MDDYDNPTPLGFSYLDLPELDEKLYVRPSSDNPDDYVFIGFNYDELSLIDSTLIHFLDCAENGLIEYHSAKEVRSLTNVVESAMDEFE